MKSLNVTPAYIIHGSSEHVRQTIAALVYQKTQPKPTLSPGD